MCICFHCHSPNSCNHIKKLDSEYAHDSHTSQVSQTGGWQLPTGAGCSSNIGHQWPASQLDKIGLICFDNISHQDLDTVPDQRPLWHCSWAVFEMLQHMQWLQSAMRTFLCKVAISAQAKQSCKAFRWFLMSINCSWFHLRGYGLEASPSDTTVASMLSASGLKCPRHIDLKVTGADMILSNLVC